ncbi:cap-specific mRNA [Nephila pilipes]|uniref:Cap-specific mRNA (nucleoside-2'-O-)-methyltransferase 2 n=1 Tax=Nephila pilipes TaxID=299642 RepID=A0A8X6T7V7_NEPPI|nr:cap-specific mRNA [Nephila pilipes]
MNPSFFDINNCFEKKFSFVHEKDWILPPENVLFEDASWMLDSLMFMKRELNDTKSLLNDKGEQWHEHTARINLAKLVISFIRDRIQPEILTQAWCKFYEILSNYRLIPEGEENFKSLHLCEAPGAFISALNCYLCINHPTINWKWFANTLNPYYEDVTVNDVICDDRLLFPTLKHWYFGQDDTGDITNPNFSKDLMNFIGEKHSFDLITADGSINCMENPAEQEAVVSELHYAELLVALYNLSPGANFVLKKFTFFECNTICKMYFLNCIFKQVHVFKPFTSKAGNSEVYVICLGYVGIETLSAYLTKISQNYRLLKSKALFPLEVIPESFMLQLQECATLFMDHQKKAITENIHLYSIPLSNYELELREVQKVCAVEYLGRCHIHRNLTINKLFLFENQIVSNFHDKYNRNMRTFRFQAMGEIFTNLEKSKSMSWQDIIVDVEKRLNKCFPLNEKRHLEDEEWCFVPKDMVNKMRSKSYKRWLSTGKKISFIRNSKFCNPMLLHLWNRVSHDPQVNFQNHMPTVCCYWDINNLSTLLLETSFPEDFCIIYVTQINIEASENDPALIKLKETFKQVFSYDLSIMESQEIEFPKQNKIIYINCTSWIKSLHQEIAIKYCLADTLSKVIKFMNLGDSVIICLQSLLTRYTNGILFMLLSLFEKFQCFLPNDVAPASCGQMWVLKNFRHPEYTLRVIRYLETIAQFKAPESMEVLQVVPISALCGDYFYEHLLDLNNTYVQRKLRNLITVEKNRLKNSM